ncbi:MAG: hypothetical protein WC644_09340 [Ignavibacteria bacterium]
MARFISPLGILIGGCGDFVYRNLNGKTVVSHRPGPQKKSNDPLVLARRNRFKLANKLSSALGGIPAVKCIWNQFGINKPISAFNKMMKVFYPHISVCDIHESFRMGPSFGNMSVESPRIKLVKNNLSAEALVVDSDSRLENLSYVQIIVLLFFKEPQDSCLNEYEIAALASKETKYVVNQTIKFDAEVTPDKARFIEVYDKRKLFYMFAGFDDDHNIIGYSNTFSDV